MRTLCSRGGGRGLCSADPFSKRKLAAPLAPPGTLVPVACSASGGPFRGPSAKRRSGAPRCALCVGACALCPAVCCSRFVQSDAPQDAMRVHAAAHGFAVSRTAPADFAIVGAPRLCQEITPSDFASGLSWALHTVASMGAGETAKGHRTASERGPQRGSAANAVVEDTASPQSEPAPHSPRAPTPPLKNRHRSRGSVPRALGAPPRRTGRRHSTAVPGNAAVPPGAELASSCAVAPRKRPPVRRVRGPASRPPPKTRTTTCFQRDRANRTALRTTR
ncbi:hypothetical protein ERJ75_000190300 [Trypanosoma vivax]|nr:hypothetical protein ERJ75_000190300 [Trypanosoma vivax]